MSLLPPRIPLLGSYSGKPPTHGQKGAQARLFNTPRLEKAKVCQREISNGEHCCSRCLCLSPPHTSPAPTISEPAPAPPCQELHMAAGASFARIQGRPSATEETNFTARHPKLPCHPTLPPHCTPRASRGHLPCAPGVPTS